MKKSQFTESEIVGILKEAEAGIPVTRFENTGSEERLRTTRCRPEPTLPGMVSLFRDDGSGECPVARIAVDGVILIRNEITRTANNTGLFLNGTGKT